MAAADAEEVSIGVFARFKPLKDESEKGTFTVSKRFGKQKSVQIRNLEFSLDWIFDIDATQEEIFEIAARDRAGAVLKGYNATIMAYGQTGSGKTFSMFGPDEVLGSFAKSDASSHGVVPRATEHIFDGLATAVEGSEFVVTVTYLEVYNDFLNDLLGGKQRCPMRETPKGIVIEGMKHEVVTNVAEVMSALQRGSDKRVVAKMSMNDRSSRGHSIFAIHVKEIFGEGGERTGKLNLVDLAGMESSKKSYAVQGASNNPARREEARNINQSLYALGSVVEKLSSGGKGTHVPWRDSKLTRLLQDSLGGNAKCTILITLRSEAPNLEESINTLRFAQRAKAVKTRVVDNTVTVQDTAKLLGQLESMQEQAHLAHMMVRQLQQEIKTRDEEEEARLKKAKASGGKGGGPTNEAMELELEQLRHKNRTLRHRAIIHRVLQVQTREALSSLKEAHSEALRQLAELEASGARPGGGGGGGGGGSDDDDRSSASDDNSRGSLGEDWQDNLISTAQDELKAAMLSQDPEALKQAIVNASGAVAKARVRNHQVLRKQDIVVGHGSKKDGGGKKDGGKGKSKQTVDNTGLKVSEEERLYLKFHEIATGRKLALASRGYEVQNVFIDELFDKACAESLNEGKYHTFVRGELPTPRDDDDDDDFTTGDRPAWETAAELQAAGAEAMPQGKRRNLMATLRAAVRLNGALRRRGSSKSLLESRASIAKTSRNVTKTHKRGTPDWMEEPEGFKHRGTYVGETLAIEEAALADSYSRLSSRDLLGHVSAADATTDMCCEMLDLQGGSSASTAKSVPVKGGAAGGSGGAAAGGKPKGAAPPAAGKQAKKGSVATGAAARDSKKPKANAAPPGAGGKKQPAKAVRA